MFGSAPPPGLSVPPEERGGVNGSEPTTTPIPMATPPVSSPSQVDNIYQHPSSCPSTDTCSMKLQAQEILQNHMSSTKQSYYGQSQNSFENERQLASHRQIYHLGSHSTEELGVSRSVDRDGHLTGDNFSSQDYEVLPNKGGTPTPALDYLKWLEYADFTEPPPSPPASTHKTGSKNPNIKKIQDYKKCCLYPRCGKRFPTFQGLHDHQMEYAHSKCPICNAEFFDLPREWGRLRERKVEYTHQDPQSVSGRNHDRTRGAVCTHGSVKLWYCQHPSCVDLVFETYSELTGHCGSAGHWYCDECQSMVESPETHESHWRKHMNKRAAAEVDMVELEKELKRVDVEQEQRLETLMEVAEEIRRDADEELDELKKRFPPSKSSSSSSGSSLPGSFSSSSRPPSSSGSSSSSASKSDSEPDSGSGPNPSPGQNPGSNPEDSDAGSEEPFSDSRSSPGSPTNSKAGSTHSSADKPNCTQQTTTSIPDPPPDSEIPRHVFACPLSGCNAIFEDHYRLRTHKHFWRHCYCDLCQEIFDDEESFIEHCHIFVHSGAAMPPIISSTILDTKWTKFYDEQAQYLKLWHQGLVEQEMRTGYHELYFCSYGDCVVEHGFRYIDELRAHQREADHWFCKACMKYFDSPWAWEEHNREQEEWGRLVLLEMIANHPELSPYLDGSLSESNSDNVYQNDIVETPMPRPSKPQPPLYDYPSYPVGSVLYDSEGASTYSPAAGYLQNTVGDAGTYNYHLIDIYDPPTFAENKYTQKMTGEVCTLDQETMETQASNPQLEYSNSPDYYNNQGAYHNQYEETILPDSNIWAPGCAYSPPPPPPSPTPSLSHPEEYHAPGAFDRLGVWYRLPAGGEYIYRHVMEGGEPRCVLRRIPSGYGERSLNTPKHHGGVDNEHLDENEQKEEGDFNYAEYYNNGSDYSSGDGEEQYDNQNVDDEELNEEEYKDDDKIYGADTKSNSDTPRKSGSTSSESDNNSTSDNDSSSQPSSSTDIDDETSAQISIQNPESDIYISHIRQEVSKHERPKTQALEHSFYQPLSTVKDRPKEFKCRHCAASFPTGKDLFSHFLSTNHYLQDAFRSTTTSPATPKEKRTCVPCQEEYLSILRLEEHYAKCHINGRRLSWSTCVCNATFTRVIDMVRHFEDGECRSGIEDGWIDRMYLPGLITAKQKEDLFKHRQIGEEEQRAGNFKASVEVDSKLPEQTVADEPCLVANEEDADSNSSQSSDSSGKRDSDPEPEHEERGLLRFPNVLNLSKKPLIDPKNKWYFVDVDSWEADDPEIRIHNTSDEDANEEDTDDDVPSDSLVQRLKNLNPFLRS